MGINAGCLNMYEKKKKKKKNRIHHISIIRTNRKKSEKKIEGIHMWFLFRFNYLT